MDTPGDAANSGIPRLLPVRFTRKRPGLILPFILGAALGAVAFGAWQAWQSFSGETIGWVFLGVSLLCGLLAVLLLWSCFYQWLLSRIPLTIVEVSGQPFHVGQSAQLAIIQPGPAALRFLRVELVCLERLTTWHRRAPDNEGRQELFRKVDETRLHSQAIIDETDVRPFGGDVWQKTCEFTLPEDAQPSYDSADEDTDEDDETPLEQQTDHEIAWRIELTGKGGPLTRFVQTFEVMVARS